RGGDVPSVVRDGPPGRAALVGPQNPLRAELGPLKLPFVVTLKDRGRASLEIAGDRYELRQGEYTGWVPVAFRAAPGVKVRGVCKFLLLSTEPEFSLYVTPVNIDPAKPVMPVGYPAVSPVALA